MADLEQISYTRRNMIEKVKKKKRKKKENNFLVIKSRKVNQIAFYEMNCPRPDMSPSLAAISK